MQPSLIEKLFDEAPEHFEEEHHRLFRDFKAALNRGEIRAAEPDRLRQHGLEHRLELEAAAPEHLEHMHARLAAVVSEHFEFRHYVDDNMRNIPDHYHAHARPVGGFFGHGLKRRP